MPDDGDVPPAPSMPDGVDGLRAALPGYARDLRADLAAVVGGSGLSEQQLWGTLLVTAIASRSPRVLAELGPAAKARLSAHAWTAARQTASRMVMNNVYHRTLHLLGDEAYGRLRVGLRTKAIGSPGVARADVELWSLAVSAVNGCGVCLDAHERELRECGVGRETVQAAIRVAAVVQAAAVTLEAEPYLS